MKAKIFSLMALVLCLVSCQTEPEGLDVIVGGEVDTVVTVTIPEAETRANTSSLGVFNNGILEDDNVTMRYILEIYYGDESRDRLVDYSDGTEVAFPVRLVPDRHYNFVVWADVVTKEATATEFTDADNHYNTTNLKAITLNGEWDAMDETRDAFTGYFNTVKDGDKKPYNGSKAINIPLIRPFAKLRVITTDFDELAKYGIKATSGQVTYSSDYSGRASFNACTGKASDAITTFLGGSYDIVEYASENGGDEHTIFSDYIFASTDGDVVKFDLDIYDLNGGRIKYNNFNTDIRVKRNYITTLKGDVLTTSGNVTVTVNPGFEEDEIVENYVDTAEDLQDAIENAEDGKETVVVLGGDVNLDDLLSAGILSTRAAEPAYGLVIPAGKKLVLDLNGKRVYQTKACSDHYSMILNNGDLTITGEGTVEFENTSEGGSSTWGTYTIENRGEAVLTIDNATIRHNGCVNGETNHDTNIAIQNYEGKVVINDGTIASPEFRSLRDFTAGGEIIINGGTFLGQVWMQGLGNGSSSLTINGGSFSPVESYDGSSVYITNSANVVNVAVTGGIFNTKVGCYDATKEGANGCITGGTFTTAAKEATSEELLAKGYAFVEGENGTYTVENVGHYTDAEGNYYITNAKGLVALSSMTIAGGKSVKLCADIDLAGVTFNGLRAFNPENSNTFDGQGYTVSNWTVNKREDDMAFLRSWVGTIKNVKFEDCHLMVGGRSAIVAANIYANIENVTVNNSSVDASWWACGIIAGLHNSGNITNCTVTNSSVKSTGGTSAIVGTMNETDGTRKFTNCTVTGCTINCTNDNAAKPWYAGGAIVGLVNLDYSTIEFNGCQTSDNIFIGQFSKDSYYGYSFSPVKINGASLVSTVDELNAAIKAGAEKIMLVKGSYTIPSSAQGKTLHLVGIGDAEDIDITVSNENGSYEGCNYNLSGSTVTFENISINTPSTSYIGYAGCKGTYKDCIINGFYCLYDNSNFENCTFNVSGDTYNIWTWSAPSATFTDCTFNSDGKSIMLYGGGETTLTVNGCVFNDNGGLVDELKAAIEVGDDYGTSSFELIVNNTVVNGFAINNKGINTGTTLWGNKNSMPQERLNVVVDGVDVY